jgi:hypothetical protein
MADTEGEEAPGTPRRRRLVTAAVVAAVLVGLVASARSADRATVDEVLEVPDLDTVRADRLSTGTPVFAVATRVADGGGPALDVIQAFVPEVEGPVTALVGWCEAAGVFVDPHHGPVYDVRGRRLPTTLFGRSRQDGRRLTALDDLIHRTSEALPGQGDRAGVARVGGVQRLQPWQLRDRPDLSPVTPPRRCRVPDAPPAAPAAGSPTGSEAAAPQVTDHAFLAARVDPERGGWQITDGWLVVQPDGRARWCDEAPGPLPDARCGEPREDVPVGFSFAPAEVGGAGAVLGGPLAVRFADGAVARVAVLPRSTWVGSSLRGTEVLEGDLVRSWTVEEPTVGVRDLEGTGRCPATYPGGLVDGVPVARVPVTAATVVDLRDGAGADAAALGGLDQLALDRGVRVEVEVDGTTCEALVLRTP